MGLRVRTRVGREESETGRSLRLGVSGRVTRFKQTEWLSERRSRAALVPSVRARAAA